MTPLQLLHPQVWKWRGVGSLELLWISCWLRLCALKQIQILWVADCVKHEFLSLPKLRFCELLSKQLWILWVTNCVD
jgi:hypothetical protein